MFAARAPVHLTHTKTPKIFHFALLSAICAGSRGLLVSIWPLLIYQSWQNFETVSLIYLFLGISGLIWTGLVPVIIRWLPRRWTMTFGISLNIFGCLLVLTKQPVLMTFGLLMDGLGTITFLICLNAYVLDYISRIELGKNESMRLAFSAICWSVGPLSGVLLMNWWFPAPFIFALFLSVILMISFWLLRLGNGKQISKSSGPAPNPFAYLRRFIYQPRLVSGWLFAVARSCGWLVYIVYLPIYCIESGLGNLVGAVALSVTNLFLFFSPFLLRVVIKNGVRISVIGSFCTAALAFGLAWILADHAWWTFATLFVGSCALIMLDVCGSLPFLMAVKPSERTEMSAVYSSFQSVSGILVPAAASIILLVSPIPGIFAVTSLSLGSMAFLARKLHSRLGSAK
jgi:ACDE family multidrug resistance protein